MNKCCRLIHRDMCFPSSLCFVLPIPSPPPWLAQHSPGGMRFKNVIRYLCFSFCIGFCTLCIVFSASAFILLSLVYFLFSLSIGLFVFLSIAMAKMPLGFVLFILFHCTPLHFVLERLPSHFLTVLPLDSNTFPPSLPHFRLKRLFLL